MNNDDLYYKYFEEDNYQKLELLLKSKVPFKTVNYRFDARRASKNNKLEILRVLLNNTKIEDKEGITVFVNADHYGDWVNLNEPFNCDSWLPTTNSIDSGTNFTQTAN